MHSRVQQPPLPSLPGIDVIASLHRAGNNWALLKNILLVFFRKNQGTLLDFTHAISEKDWLTAIHISHTLKGSSATIGAKHLSEIAGKIEVFLKEQEFQPAEDLYMDLEKSMNEVLHSLSTLMDESNKQKITLSNDPDIGNEKLIELLSDFEQSLSSDILKSEAILDKLLLIKNEHLVNLIQKIKTEFENFNFSQVRLLIADIRQIKFLRE